MFGHHRAGPSLGAQALTLAHGVPVPIWVAAIGVVAALAAPIVQHLFTRSRDRALASAEERRRADDLAQTVTRVRADLVFRLRAHLVLLAALAESSRIDVDRWHQTFERFATRTRDAEVIEALGPAYHAFVRPVHAERVAIEVERSASLGARPPGQPSERVAAVAAAYGPSFAILEAAAPLELETSRSGAR